MVCAIGLGIAVCIVTLTVYHAMSGNPIWWKNDRLYYVRMDSWDPIKPYDTRRPEQPPEQLTYKDATYLFNSNIPQRKAIMYRVQGVLQGGSRDPKPVPALTRVTSGDFFAMFDVPFLYGGAWDAAADRGPAPVIVLSKPLNDRLFGGLNSVGRLIRWNDRQFRIVGVLDGWHPYPKFYDLTGRAFSRPEDVFIPWRWGTALELQSGGRTSCWSPEKLDTFQDQLGSECTWIQLWIELPDAASRERMQAFMDAYWSEQHQHGRFARPRNNRLTNVGDLLTDMEVVQQDNRLLVRLAFAFLAVCLINTVGLLLAKFLNGAAITGVRRALGASRRQVVLQHLTEVGVLSGTGAALGLVLAVLGLWGVRFMYGAGAIRPGGGYQELAHFDPIGVLWAVALAVVATLVAGSYPAWRAGRLPPAVYLKSQ
jgi:putative ABC transport system permease protein